jgi:hypothetical protein
MSYRYRCQKCRTTSPLVETHEEAIAERRRHRDAVHGGHAPDGEQLLHYGPANSEWWTQGRALWAGAAILAFIGWLKGYRL